MSNVAFEFEALACEMSALACDTKGMEAENQNRAEHESIAYDEHDFNNIASQMREIAEKFRALGLKAGE